MEDEDTEDQYADDQYADENENYASVEGDDFASSSGATFSFRPRSNSLRRVTSFDEAEDEYEDDSPVESEDDYGDDSSLEFEDGYGDDSSLEFEDDYDGDGSAEAEYGYEYEDESLIDDEDDIDPSSGTPFPFGSGNFSRQGTGVLKSRSRQGLRQQLDDDDDDDDNNGGVSVSVAEPPSQKQTKLQGEKLLVADLDEPPLAPPAPAPVPPTLPRQARSRKGLLLLLIVVLIFSLGIVYTHFATPATHVPPKTEPTQAVVATPTPYEYATSPVLQPTSGIQSSPTDVATSSSTSETSSVIATVVASPTPVHTVPVIVPPLPPLPPPPAPKPVPVLKPTPTPTPVPQTNLVCPYQEFNQYTNLTSEGTLDWEQWGLNKATDVNRKAGVKPQISNFILLGNGHIASDHTSPISFTWSDGTPNASVKRSTGAIHVTGINNGFSITVPASTTPRTLRLYVGANLARGLFFASLGGITCKDASLDMTHDPTKNVDNAVYTITYSTNLPDQKLTIDYTEMQSNGNRGYVLLEAATLR